jgi:hypothetical protein
LPAQLCRDLPGSDLLSAVRRFGETALMWHHEEPPTNSGGDSVAAKALHLHAMNFHLWHHEDAVRRAGVSDQEVADRKRRIDDLNARRNSAIEDIDATLLDLLNPHPGAPLSTETPGTIVDRLSVLALRILHTHRAERPTGHLAVLDEQYDDLLRGLERFLARMRIGEIRFKLYRQFKSAEQRSHCGLFSDDR